MYSDPSFTGFIMLSLLMILIPFIVCVVFGVIGLWKIFQKSGKPGWAALIPVYNVFVLGSISWLNRGKTIAWTIITAVYTALSVVSSAVSPVHSYSYSMGYSLSVSSADPLGSVASLVGLAHLVFFILAMIALGKSFGKSNGFIVGLVLLSPFFIFALGISKTDRYFGPEGSWIPQMYGQIPSQYPYQQQQPMQMQQPPYQAPYGQPQQVQPQINPNPQSYSQVQAPPQTHGAPVQGQSEQYISPQQPFGTPQSQQSGQYPPQRF